MIFYFIADLTMEGETTSDTINLESGTGLSDDELSEEQLVDQMRNEFQETGKYLELEQNMHFIFLLWS